MIEPKTPPMRRELVMTLFGALMAALFLLSGCVTYHTYIGQNFYEGGESDVVVRERLAMDTSLAQDYLAQSGLAEDAGQEASNMLLQGLVEYFGTGAYANGVCSRVAAPFSCAVQESGGIEIRGLMQPDGRFYAFSTRRDWLELKETREFSIRRAPLPGFFAYGSTNETARADAEREDLRIFLDSYIDRHADQLPADSCLGAQTLGCEVERDDGSLVLRLLPDPNYAIDLSRTRVLRALCSFKPEAEFSPGAYRLGQADLHDAYVVNQTLDAIGHGGLRIPCDAGAQTLAVEVAYPAGVGPDASDLLAYRMLGRGQIQLQMHQGLKGNGTLIAAISKYSTGQFSEVTADFGANRIHGKGFKDLAQLKAQGDLGTDVKFDYEMRFPDGKLTATINGEPLNASGNRLALNLEQLSGYGYGTGLTVKVEKYLSPLGGYTWLVINLVFLLAMAFVVWKSMKNLHLENFKLTWPPPKGI